MFKKAKTEFIIESISREMSGDLKKSLCTIGEWGGKGTRIREGGREGRKEGTRIREGGREGGSQSVIMIMFCQM